MCVHVLVQTINTNLYNGSTFLSVIVFKFRSRQILVAGYKHRPIYTRENIFFSFPKGLDGLFGLGSIRRLRKRDFEIRNDHALPARHSFIHCSTDTPFHFNPSFLYDDRLRWKCCLG